MAKRKTEYAIKHDNGTYFQATTGIGPMFGGTLDQAAKFDSRDAAAKLFMTHFAFGDCEVVNVGSGGGDGKD